MKTTNKVAVITFLQVQSQFCFLFFLGIYHNHCETFRCGYRGGEMGEFSPPLLFGAPFFLLFSYPSNIEIIFDFSDIITKIHPPFQNPGSALDLEHHSFSLQRLPSSEENISTLTCLSHGRQFVLQLVLQQNCETRSTVKAQPSYATRLGPPPSAQKETGYSKCIVYSQNKLYFSSRRYFVTRKITVHTRKKTLLSHF